MKTLDTRLRARERNRWLFSAMTALAALAAVLWVSGLTFETNDDCSIVAVAAGYLTGAPDPATVSSAYGYGALLAGLYGLCGALPWHTLILLAGNAAGLTALLMGCLTLCAEYGASFLWGVGAWLGLFFGVLLPFAAQLQFSAVAGLAMAGALFLMATMPRAASRRAAVLRRTVSALLALLAFGLRPNVALMLCPLWAVLAAGTLLRRAPGRRGLLAFTACMVAGLCALYALDQALYAAEPDWAAFAAFDRQATALLDYNAVPLTAEQLSAAAKAAGFSDELLGMVRNWYFLDSRIDAASLARLNGALAAIRGGSAAVSPGSVLRATASVCRRYPMFGWNLLGWAAAAGIAAVAGLRRRRWQPAVQMAAHLGYGLLLIAYFYGVLGRFPLRLGYAVAVPTYALLLPLLFEALAGGGGRGDARPDDASPKRRWAAAALAALMLGGALRFAGDPADGLALRGAPGRSRQNAALADAINRYVAGHPDRIFVTDYCQDFSPLAVFGVGQLKNLIYWGSGISRSPAALRQLRALGYEELNAGQFFDGGVYVLLAGGDGARDALTAYLAADYGLGELRLEERTERFSVYRAVR